MVSPPVVKILITCFGHATAGIKKASAAPIARSSASPRTFLIFFTSLLPQNWAARIPEPLTMPNTSSVITKNTLLASPTAAMEVAPSEPIIMVSTMFTIVFSMPCIATGSAILTALERNILSVIIIFVSCSIALIIPFFQISPPRCDKKDRCFSPPGHQKNARATLRRSYT